MIRRFWLAMLLPVFTSLARAQRAPVQTTTQITSRGDTIAWEWPDSLPPARCDTIVLADTYLHDVANAWTNSVGLTSWARARGAPDFREYRVALTFHGQPVSVRVNSPMARRYRTRLRIGAAAGPNFADHFTVVLWGCGSPCVQVAIVDARDGTIGFITSRDTFYTRPPMYRRDSRLLVFDPTGFMTDSLLHPMEPDVAYLEWTGSRLRRVFTLHAASARLPPTSFGVQDRSLPRFPMLEGGPPDVRCAPLRRPA